MIALSADFIGDEVSEEVQLTVGAADVGDDISTTRLDVLRRRNNYFLIVIFKEHSKVEFSGGLREVTCSIGGFKTKVKCTYAELIESTHNRNLTKFIAVHRRDKLEE